MNNNTTPAHSWKDSLRSLANPHVITMLFLGFAAGLPLLLIFSTLSLWLREAGVDRADVTFFSWAALAYSFKFVWAPLVDRLPLPILTNWLGRRRGWLLLSQSAIISAIILMALTDPASDGGLIRMALAAILLGFSSATQDIVIDAYRIESAPAELQAMLSSSYIAGYRIAMLVTGAGTLFLASYLGSKFDDYHYSAWMFTYLTMAVAMLAGPITTLLVAEPVGRPFSTNRSMQDHMGLLAVFFMAVATFISSFWGVGTVIATIFIPANLQFLSFFMEIARLGIALVAAWIAVRTLIILGAVRASTLDETYVAPVREFFNRYDANIAWTLLVLIGVYRISDILLGVIANVFYQDMGFSKIEIASIVKTYGLFMTLFGGFLGGALTLRYGATRILFTGTLLSIATHLSFMALAQSGHNVLMLYLVISADNLSAGLAVAAFVAFVSSLTSVSFTAMQYAIFSSLMTLFPKLLGGYSGTIVKAVGYPRFFLYTSLLGLPILFLVRHTERLLAARTLQQKLNS